ncbi:acyltransferase [Roseomonas sp. NAR14]|uniref:Acyltransferase n=1 Tax=Roseomonas acroporae TaxID=2937791 RepID=A0A9X2BVC6_9PROT|nr:acyltransferase [Roseomonas acroporae]MCK8783869.1 acyltransferase [Roseomonas acroporae]
MQRIGCLDGVRGLAAIWVLVGHCLILTGARFPVLDRPDFGVDLFIMLSGYLMVFQYLSRRRFEDWNRPRTWTVFWTRRFFRIAPLYYLMLLLALLLGGPIFENRMIIDSFLELPGQAPERYLDSSPWNVFMHVSFLFGLFPDYAFRTPLPDWSIGLEMQFYAVFPLLILLAGRFGWLAAAPMIAGCALAVAMLLAASAIVFPMPSFLPLKMHLFLCGMLIAAAPVGAAGRLVAFLAVIALLASLPIGGDAGLRHRLVRVLIAVAFFALIHMQGFPVVGKVSALLGRPAFHWLGEMSFGVYLNHLLFMHPVAALLISQYGTTMSAGLRFAIALPVVIVLSYALSCLTYVALENPGRAMGRKAAKLMQGRAPLPARNAAAP